MGADTILGDVAGFFRRQRTRLEDLGIEVAGLPVSHVAFRTATYAGYLTLREALERHALGNVENVWNGRPISKIRLSERLRLDISTGTDLVELIPPPHQAVYRMGLEHVGFVLGDAFGAFAARHASLLTGQQSQGPFCAPHYIRFEDATNVKFYRHGLLEVCEMEGARFDRFEHVTGWVG